MIRDLDTNAANAPWKEKGMQLSAVYGSENPTVNMDRLRSKFTSNREYVTHTAALLLECMTKLTINLWRSDQTKNKQRELSAALREALKTNAMKITNDDVEDAMDEEDVSRPDRKVPGMIQKETKK